MQERDDKNSSIHLEEVSQSAKSENGKKKRRKGFKSACYAYHVI